VSATPITRARPERLKIHESPRGYLMMAPVGAIAAIVLLAFPDWTVDGIPCTWLGYAMVPITAVLAWKGFTTMSRDPVLIIDAQGILDHRLKTGLIPWSDITRIYVQVLHGSPFLCMTLRPQAPSRQAGSRLSKATGLGDLQVRLFSTTPGHAEVTAFIAWLRPDMFSQSFS
jgi:hypothetical protein